MVDSNLKERAIEAETRPCPTYDERNALVSWIMEEGRRYTRSRDLLGALCAKVEEAGLPLYRVVLSVRVLHPQIATTGYVWRKGAAEASEVDRGHEILDAKEYLSSPIRAIHLGGGPIRRRLEGTDVALDFPILEDLRDKGATDYIALPLRFSDGTINMISFASARPGGFPEDCVDTFLALLPPLTALLEVQSTRRTAATLLDTYLGHSAGERVLAGDITRGGGVTMHAVVWYSDLRQFTAMSDALPRDDLMEVLNDYFECMIDAVESGGGEVLKLIGDGVLAIFPVGDAAFRHYVCNRAVDAALTAKSNMAALNRRRKKLGKEQLCYGIALHLGDVIFGNIGAPNRLDFTVIGPAVNQVTRIEELTKSTGECLLVSEEFAKTCERALESVGRHSLRGVKDTQEVFAIGDANAS